MIKIDDASKVFFTSDTHFSHSNIINYCARPFRDKYEMDEQLILNWNEVVPEDGIVFHLGDFKWSGSWNTVLDRLNGKIHLIKGNHDYEVKRFENRFESIQEQLTIHIENQPIILNHYPILCHPDKFWSLFGHCHTLTQNNAGEDFKKLYILGYNQYEVSVDFNNYKPIAWNDIKSKIEFQINNEVNMLYWITS